MISSSITHSLLLWSLLLFMATNNLKHHSTGIIEHILLQSLLDNSDYISSYACIPCHHHQLSNIWRVHRSILVRLCRHQLHSHASFKDYLSIELKLQSEWSEPRNRMSKTSHMHTTVKSFGKSSLPSRIRQTFHNLRLPEET